MALIAGNSASASVCSICSGFWAKGYMPVPLNRLNTSRALDWRRFGQPVILPTHQPGDCTAPASRLSAITMMNKTLKAAYDREDRDPAIARDSRNANAVG